MKTVNSLNLNIVEIDYPLHMRRALTLASNVLTATPNPRVGCVLINMNNEVVGEGWHQVPGEAHAEVNAIAQAGAQAKDAIAFVTLEPCAHQGKTPPCALALIKAGIKQVYIAALDPSREVSGKGVAILEKAGVEVVQLIDFEQRALDINAGFIKRQVSGRPFVRCKLAMSLDGRTAAANRDSKWITGPQARSDVQRLRAASCAIVTGVNTVLEDDPSMSVRPQELDLTETEVMHNRFALNRQPLRVILDSKLRTPYTAKLISLDGDVKIFTADLAAQNETQFPANTEVIACAVPALSDQASSRVDPATVLELLASRFKINEVLLEAGPVLCGAFVSAGLVDELVIYIGAQLLGSRGLPLLDLPGLTSMNDKLKLTIKEVKMIGKDCRIVASFDTR